MSTQIVPSHGIVQEPWAPTRMARIDVEHKERIARKEGGGAENPWNGSNHSECLCEDGWIGHCENALRALPNASSCAPPSLGAR